LSAGHGAADLNQGALAAMLPFLIVAAGLGYAQAAGLAFAIAIASTAAQPVFGIIADKFSKAWVMPLGVLMSGLGIALVGLLSGSYWLMFAAALFSGIGVAAFHPEGARMANRLSGKMKGSAMSIFMVGGAIGVAAGPVITSPALNRMGLQASAIAAVPGIIMCVLFLLLIPGMRRLAESREREERLEDQIEEQKTGEAKGGRRNEWLKFSWLCVSITSRSIIAHSLNVFLPLYWVSVLNQSMATSGMVVSFMVITGAIVTVMGGFLADRFGVNTIIKVSWVLLIPSVFFLTHITNPVLALLMLVPIATGSFMLNAPFVVLGQRYLPKSIGLASGLILGLGGSIGGMFTPLLGAYADVHGLAAAFKLLAILPVVGAVVAFTSKPPGK